MGWKILFSLLHREFRIYSVCLKMWFFTCLIPILARICGYKTKRFLYYPATFFICGLESTGIQLIKQGYFEKLLTKLWGIVKDRMCVKILKVESKPPLSSSFEPPVKEEAIN